MKSKNCNRPSAEALGLSVIAVRKPSPDDLEKLGVARWPVWEKEPSEFDWSYADSETCYLLEGKVRVMYAGGAVEFGQGDLVFFPKGLRCVWKITEHVRKHYSFGQ